MWYPPTKLYLLLCRYVVRRRSEWWDDDDTTIAEMDEVTERSTPGLDTAYEVIKVYDVDVRVWRDNH